MKSILLTTLFVASLGLSAETSRKSICRVNACADEYLIFDSTNEFFWFDWNYAASHGSMLRMVETLQEKGVLKPDEVVHRVYLKGAMKNCLFPPKNANEGGYCQMEEAKLFLPVYSQSQKKHLFNLDLDLRYVSLRHIAKGDNQSSFEFRLVTTDGTDMTLEARRDSCYWTDEF